MNYRLFATGFFLYATTVVAGPNWQAIEAARDEKAASKQQIQEETIKAEKKQQRLQTAFEKLQTACNKVQDNDEIKSACAEMMQAYTDMTNSSR